MQTLLLVSIAVVTGVFTGALQLRLFLCKPDIVKPFSQHLDDLRLHLRSGCIVLASVLLLVFLFNPTFPALPLSAFAFTLSWVTTVILGVRSYLSQQTQS